MRKFKMNKKGIESWIVGLFIAVTIFVIFAIGYAILRVKGVDLLEFIQNLFRFGR